MTDKLSAIPTRTAMRRAYLVSLAAAASEAEVVKVAARYLSEWHASELQAIPESCRPRGAADAEALADAAFALTKCRIESSDPHPLLEEMEAFFAMACARVSELEAIPRRIPGRPYLTR